MIPVVYNFWVTLLLPVALKWAEGEPTSWSAWVTPLVVIALLIVLNGLYVAAEFAIIGTRSTQMKELAAEGNKTASHVLHILEHPAEQDKYIATAQLGITIASLGLGMYAEPAVAHLIEPYLASWFGIENTLTLHSISSVMVLSVLTYLHVVVGEMVPKSIALSHASSTVLWISRPMGMSQAFLLPFVRGLNKLGNGLLRLLRLPPPQTRVHSPEEIEQIVQESAQSGLINEDEKDIIHKIFGFSDKVVGQVMTPRRKVLAVPVDISMSDLIEIVTHSNHSRFPVYEGNLDRIIGILHLHHLIKQILTSKGKVDLRLLIKQAPAVPEDMPIEEMLAIFKQQHIHMALVLDEFGGMAGVVTLEDLVEQVVGEVRDEFDEEPEPLEEVEPGVIEVDGSYLVADLIQRIYLGHEKELPDVNTVSGLIVTELGRPPQVDDECVYNENVRFVVVAVDGRAVARARIHYPVPPATSEPADDT